MTNKACNNRAQIAIIGAGLSGLLSAIALSDPNYGAGRDVLLIDAGTIMEPRADGRVTVLTPSAIRMLERLGVTGFEQTLIMGMRVGEGADDTRWQFELTERPDEPLAVSVENEALRTALLARLSDCSVTLLGHTRLDSLSQNGHDSLKLDNGDHHNVELLIGADGRNSAVRRLAGLSVSRSDFEQQALVTTLIHEEPHEGIALQRFQPVGAVAALPLATTDKGHRSQIVWSDRPTAIEAAKSLPESALIPLIDEKLWGALSVTGLDAELQSYPLIAQRSEALTQGRIALVGDAARAVHPLAGQGFNLAVRDIAALCQGVREAMATGQDVGTAGLIGYERWRRADETALGALTETLSRAPTKGPLSLLGHARRAAFAILDEVSSLQALIRREAAGELGERPDLLL